MIDISKLALKERLKFLARDSAIYGIAATINRATSLLTVPLLARFLSVPEFGMVDCAVLLVSLLSTLILFGQDSALARYFYEVDSLEERKEVVSQSFWLQIIVIAIASPVLFMAYGWISRFVGGGASY